MNFIGYRTVLLVIASGTLSLTGQGESVGESVAGTADHPVEARDAYSAAFFIAADLDRDKSLTQREMRIFQDLLFSKADADRDGRLSQGEAMAFFAREAEKRGDKTPPRAAKPELRSLPHERDKGSKNQFERTLERLDKDGDGQLQKSEAPAGMDPLFKHYDADGNGALDLAELQRAREAGNKWKNRQEFLGALKKLDRDGDGALDREEAKGKWAKKFRQYDKNKNGFLDKGDVVVAKQKAEKKEETMTERGATSRPAGDTDKEPEMMM